MILITKAVKSKSKKLFQHRVRIGFCATIIPEVTMPRALSLKLLQFSRASSPGHLVSVTTLLAFTYLPLWNSYYCPQGSLFTASSCPQSAVTWLPPLLPLILP